MGSPGRSSLKVFGLLVLLVLQSAFEAKASWLKDAVIYQIYPRSYQDSDNDGVGDLAGITSRLGYLKDLGVSAVWLSPIYKSPMKDFGYDISDYEEIDPIFGTMDDFKHLLKSAHEKDIKVLMDFVPNHSSDEHEWFLKSLNKTEPYTDFYVWADPKGFDSLGRPIPPSNWVSVFKYSAWEYREERNQFYLHQFLPGQPDLNYRNPLVLDSMIGVLKFWLDLGVDGFRFDAVSHIWEDDSWPDEPVVDPTNATTEDDYAHYDHIYSYNLPETIDVLKAMYKIVRSYGDETLMMVESYLDAKKLIPYYECSDFPFNFNFLGMNKPVSAEQVKDAIELQKDNLPKGKYANWVFGNHDVHRVGSRVGEPLIDSFNLLALTLPEVVITYQGEEIGMVDNYNISFEQSVDPAGCNCGPSDYLKCSRDPQRTPMQWDSSNENAGFSQADKTWLPVNSNYPTINVDTQSPKKWSHLFFYKVARLIKDQLKFHYPLALMDILVEDNALILIRTPDHPERPVYVTVINFNDEPVQLDLYQHFAVDSATVSLSTDESMGDVVDIKALKIAAYKSLIFNFPQL